MKIEYINDYYGDEVKCIKINATTINYKIINKTYNFLCDFDSYSWNIKDAVILTANAHYVIKSYNDDGVISFHLFFKLNNDEIYTEYRLCNDDFINFLINS